MSEVMQPETQNVTLTSANTEYSLSLPAGTKYFSLQVRGDEVVRRAWVTQMHVGINQAG